MPPPVRQAALDAWTRFAELEVRQVLAERSALLVEVGDALDRARADLAALERRVADARARHDPRPVDATTTVHAAHARHPGVAALFAARGLPRCTDCAVGADETLAEAALGEGFHLDTLLDEIRALEGSAR